MTIPEGRLLPVPPPAVLYHATAWSSLPAILAHGLQPTGQPQVHLSADAATAVNLGSRHGCAFILAVASERMHEDGHEFFRSTDGLWLTSQVPPAYLRQLDLDGRA
ncbi:MAG: RNA 2'-phosphotransferase [Acidimicrobiia bacterium]